MAALDDALDDLAEAITSIARAIPGRVPNDVEEAEKLSDSAKTLAEAYAALRKGKAGEERG